MLNTRQQTILFQVVRAFVRNGEPVSSASVARSGVIDVSSATVRNVMGDLEGLGLLHQPHTSAGRVPTPGGLRLYVDAVLVGALELDGEASFERVDTEVSTLDGEDAEGAARSIGGLLSQLVHLTSIVSAPRKTSVTLQDIHLSLLTERRVLVILVTSDHQVIHHVVQMEEQLDRSQLRSIQVYLSELGLGLTLTELRARVRQEMEALAREWSDMVRVALEIGQRALEPVSPRLWVEGKLNVFDYEELTSDRQRLKQLLEVLEEKEQVLELIDGLLEAERPQVLIGPELDLDLGDDIGLVVCGYGAPEGGEGVLGLIGPARMDYERVIPLIDYTARALSLLIGGHDTT